MRNASSELQKTVQELKSTLARQEAIIAQQQMAMEIVTAQLKQQAAEIQTVREQVQLKKAAPQFVRN